MAHKAAQGSTKNVRDSQPKYLGVKLYAGEKAKAGGVIVRQRGTKILAGANVRIGRDHTLFATKEGIVHFTSKRKNNFDGSTKTLKVANVK